MQKKKGKNPFLQVAFEVHKKYMHVKAATEAAKDKLR